MFTRNFLALVGLSHPLIHAYELVQSYDANNWYESFTFETVRLSSLCGNFLTRLQLADPTNGFVEYVSQSDAASMGMTYTVGSQVYLGVDNTTVLSDTDTGRKSIWLESKESFLHGILIGDFAHVPGSICGLWPGLYVALSTNLCCVPSLNWSVRSRRVRKPWLMNLVVAGQFAMNPALLTVKLTLWKASAISTKRTPLSTPKTLMGLAHSPLPHTLKPEQVIKRAMTAQATLDAL